MFLSRHSLALRLAFNMGLRRLLLLLDLCVISILQSQAQSFFCGFENDFCPSDLRITTKTKTSGIRVLFRTKNQRFASRNRPIVSINGTYAYLEASGISAGDHVSLDMTRLLFLDTACLSFDYHMADDGTGHMGSLQVYVNDGWTTSVIARISGDQGRAWHSFQRTVHKIEKARWTLIRGFGYQSDIAIDNLRITPGNCSGSSGPALDAQPIIGSAIPREFFCGFESGFCENELVFRSSRGLQLDGILGRSNSGASSNGTGPTVPVSGYYAHLEVTDVFQGEYVQLEMKDIMNLREACLSFNYHMADSGNGQIGSLLIEINRSGKFEQRTLISGNHGNDWNLFQRSITNFWTARWTLTRGSGLEGDIAIDNLKVTSGWCSSATSDLSSNFVFRPTTSDPNPTVTPAPPTQATFQGADSPLLYGNNLTLRTAYIPRGAAKSWIDFNTVLPTGKLVAFLFYMHNFSIAGTAFIRMQLWRPEDLQKGEYSLQTEVRVEANLSSPIGTLYKVDLKESEQIAVLNGDRIGWTNEATFGVISFDYMEGHQTFFRSIEDGYPAVGQTYVFDGANLPAIYSVAVEVIPAEEPLEV